MTMIRLNPSDTDELPVRRLDFIGFTQIYLVQTSEVTRKLNVKQIDLIGS